MTLNLLLSCCSVTGAVIAILYNLCCAHKSIAVCDKNRINLVFWMVHVVVVMLPLTAHTPQGVRWC